MVKSRKSCSNENNEEMIEKFALSSFDKNLVESMFDHTMEIYEKIENYSLSHAQQIPHVEVKNFEPSAIKSNKYYDYPELSRMFVSDDMIERNWVNQCIDKLKRIGKETIKKIEIKLLMAIILIIF